MSIGYACMIIGIPNTGLSRCIQKNATEENLRRITIDNLSALETIIDYNIKHEIKLFRISSDIIPFGSHPINQIAWWEDYKDIFQRLGEKIKKSDMRVSMHPGQYTVLNAMDPRIVQNAMQDLQYHGSFLDALGMDHTCKLILHIGGVYGDKEAASKTFIDNYNKLPRSIKDRLIIENDDKNYTVQEVLAISKETGAPVVFDNLHHEINPSKAKKTQYEWIKECGETWKKQDGKQKIHYSQKKSGAPLGSHSDTIMFEPFMEFYNGLLDKEIDIMLEVKDKNLSAIKCINIAQQNAKAKELEEEWARYKYFVLSRSASLYQEIREMLKEKNNEVSVIFYELIEQAWLLPEAQGAEVNAAQHIWGYISKDATISERNRYVKLLEAYETNTGSLKALKNHLLKCAQTRKIEYLLNSLYFYI